MPTLYLVEKGKHPENLVRLDRERNEWESGFWAISPDTAARLVGGTLLLHRAQDQRSHFGGEILSVRCVDDGEHAGRVVFRFRATKEAVDVRAGLDGWSQEKKIDW